VQKEKQRGRRENYSTARRDIEGRRELIGQERKGQAGVVPKGRKRGAGSYDGQKGRISERTRRTEKKSPPHHDNPWEKGRPHRKKKKQKSVDRYHPGRKGGSIDSFPVTGKEWKCQKSKEKGRRQRGVFCEPNKNITQRGKKKSEGQYEPDTTANQKCEPNFPTAQGRN